MSFLTCYYYLLRPRSYYQRFQISWWIKSLWESFSNLRAGRNYSMSERWMFPSWGGIYNASPGEIHPFGHCIIIEGLLTFLVTRLVYDECASSPRPNWVFVTRSNTRHERVREHLQSTGILMLAAENLWTTRRQEFTCTFFFGDLTAWVTWIS